MVQGRGRQILLIVHHFESQQLSVPCDHRVGVAAPSLSSAEGKGLQGLKAG